MPQNRLKSYLTGGLKLINALERCSLSAFLSSVILLALLLNLYSELLTLFFFPSKEKEKVLKNSLEINFNLSI